MNNIRQVRRKRLTRSENTYDFSYGWHSLIRESLLQTSWPLSISVDSEDEDDFIAARAFKGGIPPAALFASNLTIRELGRHHPTCPIEKDLAKEILRREAERNYPVEM
ncbi:hypothetical protein NPIL_12151 [Nephila pilipes]|uniref:Uncharacterized protein n=1 Tax=Nephila pilipes TaxID=299642 RepID=A0A8X6QBC6_NEPPI|nr:hypothetical protein NPIL_12151 [Nephila pilipes]